MHEGETLLIIETVPASLMYPSRKATRARRNYAKKDITAVELANGLSITVGEAQYFPRVGGGKKELSLKHLDA